MHSDNPKNTTKAELAAAAAALEASEAATVAALRALADSAPDVDLRERVMAEISASRLFVDETPASNAFFTPRVMAKIDGRREARRSRRLSWVSHGGVAAATVLLVLAISPLVSSFWRGQAPSQQPEPLAQAATPAQAQQFPTAPAAAGVTARVREVRAVNGVEAVVLDVGLVDGVSKGDFFYLNAQSQTLRVEVLGVSPWYCYAALPPLVKEKIRIGDIVEPVVRTDLMREAAEAMAANRPPKGAFFGLGVRVKERDGALFITQVLDDIWRPEQSGVSPSRAALLGLRAGDRVVSVLGRAVNDEATFEAALAQITVRDFGLTLVVERGGKMLTCREQVEHAFPSGR